MDESVSPAAWPPAPAAGQPVVAFEFRLTSGMLGRVLSLHYMRRSWPWVVIVALLFLALEALTVDDWAHPDFAGLALWPLFGGGAIALTYYITGWVAASRAFYSTASWQRPMHVALTPTRMFMHGPGYETAQDLALLYAVRESSEAFLVFLNAVYVLIWPKAAIGDLDARQRVRQYLREGLPGKAKVKLRDD